MNAKPDPIWLESLKGAMQTLSDRMLGMKEFVVVSESPSMTGNLRGAYLPIIMEPFTLYVGVLAERSSAELIARRFLQAEGEELSDNEIASAFGEISNMLGGGVQRRITEAKAGSRLGLPVLVQGTPKQGAQNLANTGVEVRLDKDVTIKLVLVRGPGGSYTVKKS